MRRKACFYIFLYILGLEVVVSQLRAGLDVCSFLQLTPIRDKTAFFVSFNSLTKQFSIIGNTHMLTGGVGKCTCKILSSHVNLVNFKKEFHLLDLKRYDSHFAFFRMELFGLPFTIILLWMS